jgi:hypothetical protein
LEEVYDEAVIAHAVNRPLLFAGDLNWQALQFRLALRRGRVVRLLENTVQVLVQPSEQETQEFLTILLFGAFELTSVRDDGALEARASDTPAHQ